MARGRGQRGGGEPSAEVADVDRVIDAMLARIAADGWRPLSLAGIAAEAGLPIVRVYRVFPSKAAVLCGLFRRVDEAVLTASADLTDDERPRDRVFDILMRRFDALHPYKPALFVLRRELPADPPSALAVGAALLRSMRWMLEGAGVATGGLSGAIAVKLTTAAYLAAARVWLRDDSPDLAPTMAALDQRLRAFERWLGPVRRREPGEAASPA